MLEMGSSQHLVGGGEQQEMKPPGHTAQTLGNTTLQAMLSPPSSLHHQILSPSHPHLINGNEGLPPGSVGVVGLPPPSTASSITMSLPSAAGLYSSAPYSSHLAGLATAPPIVSESLLDSKHAIYSSHGLTPTMMHSSLLMSQPGNYYDVTPSPPKAIPVMVGEHNYPPPSVEIRDAPRDSTISPPVKSEIITLAPVQVPVSEHAQGISAQHG